MLIKWCNNKIVDSIFQKPNTIIIKITHRLLVHRKMFYRNMTQKVDTREKLLLYAIFPIRWRWWSTANTGGDKADVWKKNFKTVKYNLVCKVFSSSLTEHGGEQSLSKEVLIYDTTLAKKFCKGFVSCLPSLCWPVVCFLDWLLRHPQSE